MKNDNQKLIEAFTCKTPFIADRDQCAGSPYAHVKVVCVDPQSGEVQDRVLPIEALRQALQLGETLLRYTTDGTRWLLEFQAVSEFYKQPAQGPCKK